MALTKIGKEGITGISNSSDANAITIDSSERVGIGTSSPDEKLDVRGSLQVGVDGTTAGLIRLMDSGSVTEEATISTDANGGLIFGGNSGAGELIFKTSSGTERVRIDSAGRVGIGVVPTAQFSHNILQIGNQATLGANAALSTTGQTYLTHNLYYNTDGNLRVFNTSSANEGAILQMVDGQLKFSNSSATTGTPTVTERMKIDSSGDLYVPRVYANTTGNGANVFVGSDGQLERSTSSQRYKNTINDATHGLTELLTLRPVTYKGNNDGDTVYGGLIAEEVHDAGLTEFVQYNDDGEPDALAYGNMVSLCIKAIQELKAELDSAKARITALENGE